MVYCIKLQQEIETRIPFVSDTIARHFICSIVPSPREREHSKQSPRLCSIVPSPWGREHSKTRQVLCSIVPSPRGREHSKQSQGLCSIVPSPRSREHSKTRQGLCIREHSLQFRLPAQRALLIDKPYLQIKNASQQPDGTALPLSQHEKRRT
jgi:hypothetical protein